MIYAEGATLQYLDQGRAVFACRDLDLHVGSGEFLGILGPSGSGKSSMLYLLSGLKLPTSGDVLYGSLSLKSMHEEARSRLRLREFGFVFQQPYLLGYLTALENVLVAAGGRGQRGIPSVMAPPLPLKGGGRARVGVSDPIFTPMGRRGDGGGDSNPLEFAYELLTDLGLADKAHRRPHELSGGERQRVCVARALVSRPKVIFADEPTAALDHTNGISVVGLLNRLRGSGSLVMVTHDPTMLQEADRVVTIEDGKVRGQRTEDRGP